MNPQTQPQEAAVPARPVTPNQPQPVAPTQTTPPVAPAHFDYAALINRKKPSHTFIFWLILLAGIVFGVGLLVLGGMLLDTVEFVGALFMTVGLLLTMVPIGLYVTKINKATMELFTAANGIEYKQKIFSLEQYGYDWMINQIQRLVYASITEKIQVTNRSFSEIGNMSFSVEKDGFVQTATNKREVDTYVWSYVRIPLPRAVPRIILDSLKNDGVLSMNKLPLKVDKGQKLSLEGNLDSYFALYAPLDYAQDAYYIFRPEVLTMLANMAQAYDLELIGTDLFVYRHKPVRFTHPEDIEEMANVADALQRAFYETTKNYKNSFNDVLTSEQLATKGQSLQTH